MCFNVVKANRKPISKTKILVRNKHRFGCAIKLFLAMMNNIKIASLVVCQSIIVTRLTIDNIIKS